jgi:hypothetical protein
MSSILERVRVGRVEQRRTVPPDLAQVFLGVYRDAFTPLEQLSPTRQALSDEEFLAAMDDRSVVKFIGLDRADEPCAMVMMATDLKQVPWISVPYYAARFPEQHRRGAIYYVEAMLVRARSQGGPWARLMLEELAAAVTRDRAVAAFDCCNYTVDVAKVPEMFARVARRVCDIDPIELDRQHYYGYVFEEKT